MAVHFSGWGTFLVIPYEQHLGALLRVAENAITVRDIMITSMWGPQRDDDLTRTVERMTSEDYDVAPVMESPIRQYVIKDELESMPDTATIEDAAQAISADDLITSGLPIADALRLLNERDWFFVIEGHRVKGMFTIADLQSLTVGLVVLGFILAAEAGIDALVEHYLPGQWHSLLTDDRMGRVEEVFMERQGRNAEIDRLSCLNLDDRLTILRRSPQLRDAVGMSGRQLRRTSETLKRLRDSLAHGDSILDFQDEPRRGIFAAQEARDFADAVWDVLATVSKQH